MQLRKFTEDETRLIGMLLREPFPGSDAILDQLRNCQVTEIDSDGSLQIHVTAGPRVQTNFRIPVEAEFVDQDGVTAHVLLHVVDERVAELEMYKEDSSPLINKFPKNEDLTLFRPET
jgi:hypothetical protein